MGGLLEGGGGKGYVGPPLKLLEGPGPPWPPSSYAYVDHDVVAQAAIIAHKTSACVWRAETLCLRHAQVMLSKNAVLRPDPPPCNRLK